MSTDALSKPEWVLMCSSIGLPEAAWLVGNVSQIYSPELKVGFTPVRC